MTCSCSPEMMMVRWRRKSANDRVLPTLAAPILPRKFGLRRLSEPAKIAATSPRLFSIGAVNMTKGCFELLPRNGCEIWGLRSRRTSLKNSRSPTLAPRSLVAGKSITVTPSGEKMKRLSNRDRSPARLSRSLFNFAGSLTISGGITLEAAISAPCVVLSFSSISSATRETRVCCWLPRTSLKSVLTRYASRTETSTNSVTTHPVTISVTFVFKLRIFTITAPRSRAKFESLDFSGRRFGQLVEKLDPARVLVGRELVLDVLLELGFQGVASGVALLENDKGFGLDELALVFGADHRRFEHGFMRDESGFDLGGRDVDARDLQHVVGAPAVYVVAVPVQAVLVAALRPASHESAAAFLVIVPIACSARRPADLQLSHLSLLCRVAALVHQAQLVARHRFARGAVAQVARPVGEEDVQHLGRPDSVQDLQPGPLLPALRDLRREGLPRPDAQPPPHLLPFSEGGARQHRSVERRHSGEKRRFLFREPLEHGRRRRALGHQNRSGAGRERKGERVAEAVREKELCRGEDDIAFLVPEDRLGVELRREDHARMNVNRTLRHAGRAGGIQPEAGIVGRGRCGCKPGFSLRQHLFELGMALSAAPGDDDVLEESELGNEGGELWQQLLRYDERLRAAVGEHVLVIFRGEQGIHRDRNDARLDRAEKRRGKVDRVGEREQHAMLHLQAHRLQPRPEAVDALGELPARVMARVVDVGDLGRAARCEVALDEVVGGVVVARNPDDGRADRMIGGAAPGHRFLVFRGG